MKINISGSIETGQNFQQYAEEEFSKGIARYFETIPSAEVHLKKQATNIYTSIVVNDVFRKGVKITAEAEESEARRSFDEALKKLFIQLKKEKDKVLTKKKKGK